MPTITHAEAVARAKKVAEVAAPNAASVEKLRRVPPENVEAIVKSDLIGLIIPKERGGYGIDSWMMVADVVGEVGRVCGATGWCFDLLMHHHWVLGMYPAEAQDLVHKTDPRAKIGTSFMPAGKATPAPGGFRVSGEWSFASGVDRALINDMPIVENVAALRHGERGSDVLLDDDDRLPLFREAPAYGQEVPHDDRGQTLERLVQQDDLRIADQRASDRQHLLLAAGKVRAAAPAALGEPRKHVVDALDGPPIRRGDGRQLEIFGNAKASEDAPLLGHELHSAPGDLERWLAVNALAVEADRSGPRSDHPHERLERRGLAGAISPQERHHLVLLHAKRHVEEDVGIAVIAVDGINFEEAHAACTPPR